jgi:hypothetical protein
MCYINKAIKNDKVVKAMVEVMDINESGISFNLENKAEKIIN